MMSQDQLVKQVLTRRDSLDASEIKTRSRLILGKLETLPALNGAATVGCYLPFGSEVNTREMIDAWLARGVRVAVPVEAGARLSLAELKAVDALQLTPRGRPEPNAAGCTALDPGVLDALLVPGVAYTRDRRRLGYGDGLYDELLARVRCVRIAPAYDLQMVRELPVSETSGLGVDLIITETSVIEAP